MEDNIEGEIEIPEVLTLFFKYFIGRVDSWQQRIEGKQRKTSLTSQNVVFASTLGLSKPMKHLQLGITFKSVTGTQKVTEMMYKLSQFISYHASEDKKEFKQKQRGGMTIKETMNRSQGQNG